MATIIFNRIAACLVVAFVFVVILLCSGNLFSGAVKSNDCLTEKENSRGNACNCSNEISQITWTKIFSGSVTNGVLNFDHPPITAQQLSFYIREGYSFKIYTEKPDPSSNAHSFISYECAGVSGLQYPASVILDCNIPDANEITGRTRITIDSTARVIQEFQNGASASSFSAISVYVKK